MPERFNKEPNTPDIIHSLFQTLDIETQQRVLIELNQLYLDMFPRVNANHQRILLLNDVVEQKITPPPLSINGLTVHFDGTRPVLNGESLRLSRIQSAIVQHLALNPGVPTPTNQLYEIAWDDVIRSETNPQKLVHPAISRLRQKLGDDEKPYRIICSNDVGYYIPRPSNDLKKE